MTEPVQLYGYRYSAYTRVARLALLSKGVTHHVQEVDPFGEASETYLTVHPFGRVPALSHGSFKIFETNAITRYVDRMFDGPSLQPHDAASVARMDQVIAVVDAYAYWPMVRQVASHSFFRPFFGDPSSSAEVETGLVASAKALSFLDGVAKEGFVLTGYDITLADCHVAPMIDYFVRAEEGAKALSALPNLQNWWDRVSALTIMHATDPFADVQAP